ATQVYIEKYNIEKEARFDIVSIILNTNTKQINHIEDAFYPVL
ncbi:MAG: endonuclease, partial [Bacteroidetes bacterium HGW-Bacteroidetes-9]